MHLGPGGRQSALEEAEEGWPATDFGLHPLDGYQLVTQISESPVANVCDPNYTFVAKLHKQYLPERTVYGGVHTRLRDIGRAYLAERG